MYLLRRVFIVAVLLILACGLCFATNMKLKLVTQPTGCSLSWSPIPNASFYDIYIDGEFVVRLDNNQLSYTLTSLLQKTSYSVIIGARTSNNETLDAETLSFTTTSWEGVYKWVNTTNDDNDGKMKDFILRVKLVEDSKYGQYNQVETQMDGKWYVIFPFGSLDNVAGWKKFKGTGDDEVVYRMNCERFNTTAFTPSQWKIDKIYLDKNYCGVDITTKAFGFQVQTATTYTFSINEKNERICSFENKGSGVAEMALFHNPIGDDPFIFILKEELTKP